MIGVPLIIGQAQKAAIARLREKAAAQPVNVQDALKMQKTPTGRVAHLARMRDLSIPIPTDFLVTFSVETGHPVGTCRHLSVSVGRHGRVPHPAAVLMICEEFGFNGGLESCQIWREDIGKGDSAVNVIQPLFVQPNSNERAN